MLLELSAAFDTFDNSLTSSSFLSGLAYLLDAFNGLPIRYHCAHLKLFSAQFSAPFFPVCIPPLSVLSPALVLISHQRYADDKQLFIVSFPKPFICHLEYAACCFYHFILDVIKFLILHRSKCEFFSHWPPSANIQSN